MSEQQPTAFFSYARWDDRHDGGYLSQFRKCLADEVQAQTGVEFLIFQDQIDVAWGQDWQQRITDSLNETVFFIPIITPTFFTRPACREELQLFMEPEKIQGGGDLILPIYYISSTLLEDEADRATDLLTQLLHIRQFVDWRELRYLSLQSVKARRRMEQLAEQIHGALRRMSALQAKAVTAASPNAEDQSVDHFKHAVHLWVKGEVDGAIAEYRQALAINPNYADARNDLGVALQGKGDLDGAVAEFRQAIALSPDVARSYFNLGLALMDKGDLNGAIEEFRTAIEQDPSDAVSHRKLGIALWEQDDIDGAIMEFQQALALSPAYADAMNQLGAVLQAKGDLNGAVAVLRQAVAQNPDEARSHCNLGIILTAAGEMAQAVDQFRQALALDPHYLNAHVRLGLALRDNGDLKGALDELRLAAAQDPSDAFARESLDVTLATTGTS